MTREGRWTIGILLCVLMIILLIPEPEAPDEQTSAKLTKTAEQRAEKLKKEKKEKYAKIVRHMNENVEIKGLKTANEDIELRNPFTYQHETRGEKIILQDNKTSENTDKKPTQPATTVSNTPQTDSTQKKVSQWKLTGIIISGDLKQAILSRNGENITLAPGDSFEGGIVVDINEGGLSYIGQSGSGSLRLPNP